MKKLYPFILFFGIFLSNKAQTPSISTVSPSEGSVGALVTVTGTNLSNPSLFTIGNITAISVSNDGSKLVGMVMPGAVTAPVSITTPGGTVTSINNFVVTPTPYPAVQQGGKLVGTGATGINVWNGFSVDLSADGNTAIVGAIADNLGKGACWIYVRIGSSWVQQGSKLVGTGSLGQAGQGYSVALSADGNTAIESGNNDPSSGATWVFVRNGTTWTQQGIKLVGTGAIGNYIQGASVSLSADGNTAIIGGYRDNSNVGAAWIFTRSGTTWSQLGNKLIGTGAVGLAEQGNSVALSADGNTAIIGGRLDNSGVGASWIFTRNGTSWTQQGNKLVGIGAVGNSYQGQSVALSADGNTAMIGGSADNGGRGATWVFTRNGTTWNQQGNKLTGTGAIIYEGQGCSVSVSADGNVAIVGGSNDSLGSGAVWVFKRTGTTWVQQGTKLRGTGNVGFAVQGLAVALSSDGSTMIEGGPSDNSSAPNAIGAAWVFGPLGVGINELRIREEVKIFPNPSNSLIQLKSDNPMQQAVLIDLCGQVLLEKSIQSRNGSIDVSTIVSGVYVLRCEFKDGEVVHRKILVQH